MKIFALKKIEMNAETNKTSLDAFLRCRLIPLDKNLGLRTIGIKDVLRRIARKVVM